MGDPTVLGMIHESVQNIEKEVIDINKQVVKNQLDIEKNNGRLYTQASEIKNIKAARNKVHEHIDNPDIHFSKEKAQETSIGYLAKKRILIIFLTALGILVSTATAVAVAWMNGLFGGT